MDMVVSINGVAGGFIMGNPVKMDDLGVPPRIGNLYIAMENENLESMIDQDKNPKADDFP